MEYNEQNKAGLAEAIGDFILENGCEQFYENEATSKFFEQYLPKQNKDRKSEVFSNICLRIVNNSIKVPSLKSLWGDVWQEGEEFCPIDKGKCTRIASDCLESYLTNAIKSFQKPENILIDRIEQFRRLSQNVRYYDYQIIQILHNARILRNKNTHETQKQYEAMLRWLIYSLFTIETLVDAINKNTSGIQIKSYADKAEFVIYRKEDSRQLYSLNISSRKTINLPLNEGNYYIEAKIMGETERKEFRVMKTSPGESFAIVTIFDSQNTTKDYGVDDEEFKIKLLKGNNLFHHGQYNEAYNSYNEASKRHQCKMIDAKKAVCQIKAGLGKSALENLINIVADEPLDLNTSDDKLISYSPEAHYWLAWLLFHESLEGESKIETAQEHLKIAEDLHSLQKILESPYLNFYSMTLLNDCEQLSKEIEKYQEEKKLDDPQIKIDKEIEEFEKLGIPTELRGIPNIKEFFKQMKEGDDLLKSAKVGKNAKDYQGAIEKAKEAKKHFQQAYDYYNMNVANTKIATCLIFELGIQRANKQNIDENNFKKIREETYNILGSSIVEKKIAGGNTIDPPSPEAYYWLAYMHLHNLQPFSENFNLRFNEAEKNLVKSQRLTEQQKESPFRGFLPINFKGNLQQLGQKIKNFEESAGQTIKDSKDRAYITKRIQADVNNYSTYFSLIIAFTALAGTWYLWDFDNKMGLLLFVFIGAIFIIAAAFTPEKLHLPSTIFEKEHTTFDMISKSSHKEPLKVEDFGEFNGQTHLLEINGITKYKFKDILKHTILWVCVPFLTAFFLFLIAEIPESLGMNTIMTILKSWGTVAFWVACVISIMATIFSILAILHNGYIHKNFYFCGVIRQSAPFPFTRYNAPLNYFIKWLRWSVCIIIIILFVSYLANVLFVKQPWKNSQNEINVDIKKTSQYNASEKIMVEDTNNQQDNYENNTRIRFAKDRLSLNVGETKDLSRLIETNIDGLVKKLKWNVDNKNIANIDSRGKIIAKSSGECKVSAEDENTGKKVSVILTVIPQFKIEQPSRLTLSKREKKQLSVSTGDNVTWSSDDETIATVETDGTLAGISSGETIIRAINEKGQKDEIKVIVKPSETDGKFRVIQ